MKNLDDLDPLPKLPRGFRMMHKDNEWYSTPASRRHEAEMAKKRDKLFGEDWQPYKRDGQIVPHTYINGQGQLKTDGYQPDVPDPDIIVVFDETSAEVFWPNGVPVEDWLDLFTSDMSSHPDTPGERAFKLSDLRQIYAAYVPQTQTASQMESKNWYQEQIAKQMKALKAETELGLSRSQDLAAKDSWIPHKPGDPMPCDPEQVVWIKLRDGTLYEGDEAEKAVYWEWDALEEVRGAEIIAWKPAT
jgi:hypothetical protein